MEPIEIAETLVLLLGAALALTWLSRRLAVPYPVVLLLGEPLLQYWIERGVVAEPRHVLLHVGPQCLRLGLAVEGRRT